jgi:hypothetical protein
MARLDFWNLEGIYRWLKFNGADEDDSCSPPWIRLLNKGMLKHFIKLYANDANMRNFKSDYSAGWMRRWWTEKLIINKLLKIYEH